jgi:hypothetical protein
MRKILLAGIVLSLLFITNSIAQDWKQISKTLPVPYNNSYRYRYGHSVSIDDNFAVVGAYAAYKNDNYIGCAFILYYDGNSWEIIAKLTASDADIDDDFGKSVSISGDVVVIGAEGNDDSGSSSGSAYIYQKPIDGWRDMTETAKLLASDGSTSDYFGSSVSVSGDIATVGAYGDDDNGSSSGSIYVFQKPEDGWGNMTETAKLHASDGSSSDRLGIHVFIHEDIIAASSTGDDDNGSSSGSVYVFKKPISGWINAIENAKLTASDGESNDYFGSSLALINNIIAVGATGDDDSGSSSGAVYVFEKAGDEWLSSTETAKLKASDGMDDDYFGTSVAVQEDCIVVGASGEDSFGDRSGAAYIFEKPNEGWLNLTESAKILPSNGTSGDYFGCSVGISSNRILVGADHKENGYQRGSSYIYDKPESGWESGVETFEIKAKDLHNKDDEYGYSVDINGNYAVVGARTSNYGSGCAYVLYFNGNCWKTIATLRASDAYDSDLFGASVGISDNQIVVGAYYDGDNGYQSGSAYVFTKPENGWKDMTETAKLLPSDGSTGDYFGYSVDISKDIVVVGARNDDDNAKNCGSAYIFQRPLHGWENGTETAKLTASDGGIYDNFGISVKVSNNDVVIGAVNVNGATYNSGFVYVFNKPLDGWKTGTETCKLTPSDGENSDLFGASVSIDGEFILVGAYGDRDNGYKSGSAYLFQKPVDGWENMTEIAKLKASDGIADNYFGISVDISEDNLIIGAYGNDDNGSYSGSAYLFTKPLTGWENMNETKKIVASDTYEGDSFGNSVGIFGENILIGAKGSDKNGKNSGAVYFYANVNIYNYNNSLCESSDFIYELLFQEESALFQWQKNIDGVWHNMNEETNDILIIENITLDMSGDKYRCIISSTENDTSDIATLTVNPIYSLLENVSVCAGSNYTFPDGTSQNNITTQVIYTSNLQSEFGCDSIIETIVDVNPVFNLSESVSVCIGSNYTFPDGTSQNNITNQVIHTSNLQSEFGCDSIIETTVNVNPIFSSTENVSVCAGSNYIFPDGTSQNNITTQVIYISNLQTIFGCDSIIETTVDVNPAYNLTETVEINSGESYTFPDGNIQNNITSQVIYISNLQTVFGCDSIIETTVNVGDTEICYSSESVTVCSGSDYTFPDGSIQNDITSQVVYESYIELADECDKIIETTVNVNPTDITNLTETICQGESITIAYGLFSYTGLYGITLKNEFGCDSVIKLDLTVVDLKVNLGSDVSINLDDTLVLDAGEDFETYYWSTEESSQTIEIDGEIGIGAHIYNVRVTDINSCVASDTIIITVNSLTDIGLINNLEGRVKVYPNPTSDKLNIEFVENTEAIEISLYDIIGNLLLQKEMKPQETKRTIQIPGENGVYFIRIRSEYSSKTYKIIKN